jgi:hypothetical protein
MGLFVATSSAAAQHCLLAGSAVNFQLPHAPRSPQQQQCFSSAFYFYLYQTSSYTSLKSRPKPFMKPPFAQSRMFSASLSSSIPSSSSSSSSSYSSKATTTAQTSSVSFLPSFFRGTLSRCLNRYQDLTSSSVLASSKRPLAFIAIGLVVGILLLPAVINAARRKKKKKKREDGNGKVDELERRGIVGDAVADDTDKR